MPFKRGQSGNPGSRPKVVGEVQALAREHTKPALATLVTIMKDKKCPPAARVAAAKVILDRGYGKPAQTLAGDRDNPIGVHQRIERIIVDPPERDG